MEQVSTKPLSERDNKLTKWAAEPELKNLKDEFLACESTHGALVANINQWASLHKGELPVGMKADKTRSQAQPKLVRRQAEWKYSALSEPMLSSNRLFTIKPTTGEDQEAAVQNELLLNHQFNRTMNRVAFVDDFVRSAVDEGTVIVRTGWNRETRKVKKKVDTFDYYSPNSEEEKQLIEQALQAREADPTTFELRAASSLKAAVAYFDQFEEIVIAIATGEKNEIEEEQIIKNCPTAEVIDPRNLRIDPTCGGDITKAMFMIYSYETNRAQLLADRKALGYKNLDKVDWQAVGPLQTEYHHAQSADTSFQFNDKSRKKVVVHEYWGMYDIHKTGQLVPIVACWLGDILIRMAENPFPDGLPPFVIVPYMPQKRSVYGESDAALLGDQQQNIGALLRGMIDILGRSAAGQTGVAAGTLDAVNKKRFENGQNYQFNPNMPAQNAIVHHTYPELSSSAVNLMTILNNDAESITGTKAFSGGMSGDGYGKVAAGIRGMLDSAAKREMGILRRLVMGLIEIARKFIAMNQVFLSDKEVIRVTNTKRIGIERPEDQTDEEFVTINRAELKGFFDIEIDIATAEVDEAQSQDLGFMLQTLGPKGDWNMVKIILMEIARLKRLPHLEKAIKEYEPKPDPVAAKKAELEVALLEVEIAEAQAKSELMKAQAKKALAEAGETDLDTAETEQGVKHERALQLAQAQGEANQTYEVTKALVKPQKEGEKPGDVEAAIGFNELTKDANKPAPRLPPIEPEPMMQQPVDMAPPMQDQGFAGPIEPVEPYV
jgi:hypothetical protein